MSDPTDLLNFFELGNRKRKEPEPTIESTEENNEMDNQFIGGFGKQEKRQHTDIFLSTIKKKVVSIQQ